MIARLLCFLVGHTWTIERTLYLPGTYKVHGTGYFDYHQNARQREVWGVTVHHEVCCCGKHRTREHLGMDPKSPQPQPQPGATRLGIGADPEVQRLRKIAGLE